MWNIYLTILIMMMYTSCTTTKPEVVCLTPIVFDMADSPWETIDEKAVLSRIEYCKKTYEETPCLVSFTKWRARQYTFRCGT